MHRPGVSSADCGNEAGAATEVDVAWVDRLPADAQRRNQLGKPLLFSTKPAAFGELVVPTRGDYPSAVMDSETNVVGLEFIQPVQRYVFVIHATSFTGSRISTS